MLNHASRGTHSRLRFALAALCCGVYTACVIALAAASARDPMAPLFNVGWSAFGVLLNFAVCLGSVAVFGLWRKQAQRRERQDRDRT